MIKHHAYPAAAKDQFPYADWGGGDGPFCVVRKCARYYQRGYTTGWWKRWHIRLFDTEAEAEANLRLPCGIDWDKPWHEPHCIRDHFIFHLALAGDVKKMEPKIEPVEPDRQGRLF